MKNTILIFVILLFSIASLAHSKEAESFSVLCTPIEEGIRIDFQKEENKFVEKNDKNSLNVFRVNFDLSSESKLTITVIPTADGKKEGMKEEDYVAELIHYSDDMMIVGLKLPHGLAKFQMLALYVNQGLAYLISTVAYIGHPNGKDLSDANPAIPEASAYVFPMTAKMIKYKQ